VGVNAPLYAMRTETGNAVTQNVNFTVNYWLSKGFPACKINLGMETYVKEFILNEAFLKLKKILFSFQGASFTLTNPSQTFVGAPASGAGAAGPVRVLF
jgi:hypothetical protein